MATATAPAGTTPQPAPCCPPLLEGAMSAADAAELAGALKVLADPARLRLLSLIAAAPDGEACVCDLIAPLGLAQPTVSHHLRQLTQAGLVTRERRASFAYYRLVPERLAEVREALTAPDLG